jgi:disulfide bond formation protein DsbB
MLWVQYFDLGLGIATVMVQVAILGLVGLHIWGKETKLYQWLEARKGLLAFILVLAATLGSLVYSEIMGLEPCRYCWYQRIFIYPQVIILGIALYKKEVSSIKKYLYTLSGLGIAFAGYHYLAQKLQSVVTTNCNIYTVDCSSAYVNVFDYITIPMMSLTILVAVILLLSLKKK